ncbi:MAG: Fpg/Nei family DNA glycosylase [Opitutales bacterium]|jgi:formamidopyrimidine-DNA glycosylase
MPELAEVEFYRQQWAPGLAQTVQGVRLHPKARVFRDTHPDAISRELLGQRLEMSHAHGKQILFCFSGGGNLGIHLGMSGSMTTAVPEMVPDRHDHLVLVMENCSLVLTDPRMFGKVTFEQGPTPPAWWKALPPQPQDPRFDKNRLRQLLGRHPRKALKAVLLHQKEFPGVGNWMADEILFRSRIHPATLPVNLTPYRLNGLYSALKTVCEDALHIIGTNWGDPPDDWLFNHRWKRGGTCPLSGKPLVYETIGGRTTCYSPSIQKIST